MSMFIVYVTTNGYKNVLGLYCSLRPCWCPRAALSWSHPLSGWHGKAGTDGIGTAKQAPMVWTRENWRADQLRYYLDPDKIFSRPSLISSPSMSCCWSMWKGQSFGPLVTGSPQLRAQLIESFNAGLILMV